MGTAPPYDARNMDESEVAGLMPEAVVDVLEVVDVEEENSNETSVQTRIGDCGLEHGKELSAIRQGRERIIEGGEQGLSSGRILRFRFGVADCGKSID